MAKLVIVESPAKATTIQKYLGEGYEVTASMGHIEDLPKSKLGVDVENGFQPVYVEVKGKEDLIKSLKKMAQASDQIYLATDPDREGEAISWHLANILGLDLGEKNRVTFNEITKTGVKQGMEQPRTVDLDLVNAQQARRILDRLVGYKLSPFLWRKVRVGLSAGRVQSVAVRIIVDREEEIRAFKTKEYWSIDAQLTAKSSRKAFEAKAATKGGKKLTIDNEEQANAVLRELEGEVPQVTKVVKSVRRKTPAPPFITSTLQQEASRKLGFQSRRTMKAAQELYEGVEVAGVGSVGLITYMRTDSLRISQEALEGAASYIEERYSKAYLPSSPRVFKSKASAQDAHEAIRPTLPLMPPERVKESLTTDQYKIYKLVWDRFIASQMANALLDTVKADITMGDYLFRASGFTVKFDGFTVLYEEGKDEEDEKSSALPALEEGEVLKVKEIKGNQHFTQPPARFTEATLIKTMEQDGIGRPSTYAPTISTILNRGYVERDGKQLKPTPLGEVTTQLFKDLFSNIVNEEFTAKMEGDLDQVETGSTDWVKMLDGFYREFSQDLANAEKAMEGKRVKIPVEETDEVCELCGKPMVIKTGRFGKFLACSGFPDCKNTKKIVKPTGGFCPKCGGKILQKKSKNGKKFFGCEHNPQCDFLSWDEPTGDACPKCGKSLLRKRGKAGRIYCSDPGCDYSTAPVKNATGKEAEK